MINSPQSLLAQGDSKDGDGTTTDPDSDGTAVLADSLGQGATLPLAVELGAEVVVGFGNC